MIPSPMAIYLMAMCFSLTFFQGGEEAKEKRSSDPNAPMRWRSGFGNEEIYGQVFTNEFQLFQAGTEMKRGRTWQNYVCQ